MSNLFKGHYLLDVYRNMSINISNKILSKSIRNRDVDDYLNFFLINVKKEINVTVIDMELWNVATTAIQLSFS